MEHIQFDSGIEEFRINGGGVLRMNPADPNLYARFLEAGEEMLQVERELREDQQDGIRALCLADRKMKEVLNRVFGCGNDFQKLLQGVNLMAVGKNGQRVVTNLFAALEPVLLEGARRCVASQVEQAVQKAHKRREEA